MRLGRLSMVLALPLLAACGSSESETTQQPEPQQPVARPLGLVDEITLTGAYPKVAMADDGSGVVVWTDGPRVHALRYDPMGGWGEPEVVFQSQGANPLVPPTTIDIRDGRVVLTFIEYPDGTNQHAKTRLYASWGSLGGSWQLPQVLDGYTGEDYFGPGVHSVAASIGPNESALVSWLWGSDLETGGFNRSLRYSTHVNGSWSAPVIRTVGGAPPWRPALMSSDALGPSTLAIGADTEVAIKRCGIDGKCLTGPALTYDSPPGYMPLLATGANQEIVALLKAPVTVSVSIARLQRDVNYWDLPIETDLPADVSLTVHAETSALATWMVADPVPGGCASQLLASQYRPDTGLGEQFTIQPPTMGASRHDAASAPSGVALVAWTGSESNVTNCGARTFSIRRIELDGSMSEVVPLGPEPILPQYYTFDTTIAVSSAGAGMFGWTDRPSYLDGDLPIFRIVVVD